MHEGAHSGLVGDFSSAEQKSVAHVSLAVLTCPGEPSGAPRRQAQPVDSSKHAVIPNTAMFRTAVFRRRAPIPLTAITEPPIAPSAQQITQSTGRV